MLLRTSIISALQRSQNKKKEKIKKSLNRKSQLLTGEVMGFNKQSRVFSEDLTYNENDYLDHFDIDSVDLDESSF